MSIEKQPIDREMVRRTCAAWLRWVEDGAGADDIFHPSIGLCYSVYRWVRYGEGIYIAMGDVNEYMENLFAKQGLNPVYPFGGGDVFDTESMKGTLHLNEYRVQWARYMAR